MIPLKRPWFLAIAILLLLTLRLNASARPSNITIEDLIIAVKNRSGQGIPAATLTNKTQHYALAFDSTGVIDLSGKIIKPDDEIAITCIGYHDKLIKGGLLLSANVITLDEDIVALKEVVIKNTEEEFSFKNAQSLPFPLFYPCLHYRRPICVYGKRCIGYQYLYPGAEV